MHASALIFDTEVTTIVGTGRAEPDLKPGYNLTKSELDPDWQEIRQAACAAWDRVDRNWNAKR